MRIKPQQMACIVEPASRCTRRESEDGYRRAREDEGEEVFSGNGIDEAQKQHPQRMRIRLHSLDHVPARPKAVHDIVDGAEGDIGVFGDPSVADDGAQK